MRSPLEEDCAEPAEDFTVALEKFIGELYDSLVREVSVEEAEASRSVVEEPAEEVDIGAQRLLVFKAVTEVASELA